MFMRSIFTSLAIIFLVAGQTPLHAEGAMTDLDGVKTAKTVWDISTGNEAKFNSRIRLIKQTADGFRKKGITPKFVVLIRGGASKFVTKTIQGTKFAGNQLQDLNLTQSALASLSANGIPVRVCKIAMKGKKIRTDNVLKFVTQVDNSFENLIALQIKGYAYMEVE